MGVLSNNITDPYFINRNWFGVEFELINIEGNYADIEQFFDVESLINAGNRWVDDIKLNTPPVQLVPSETVRDAIHALDTVISHSEIPNLASTFSGMFLSNIRKHIEYTFNDYVILNMEKWDWDIMDSSYSPTLQQLNNHGVRWTHIQKVWGPVLNESQMYLYDRIKIDVILPARIDDKLSFDNSFSLIYQQRRLRNGNTI